MKEKYWLMVIETEKVMVKYSVKAMVKVMDLRMVKATG